MNILQLCKKYPHPPKDGESIAILNLATSLPTDKMKLDMLAMRTTKHFSVATEDPIPGYRLVQTVAVDNRVKPLAALVNLAKGTSYHIDRFISPGFEQRLCNMLQQTAYDIVLLETIYLTPYIPVIKANSRAKIVLRSHNIEHEIWERMTTNTRHPLKKRYLKLQTTRLKKYELKHLNDYDLVLPITQRDAFLFDQLGLLTPKHITPIGLDIASYPAAADVPFSSSKSIGFIGSLDWMPNLEGLEWFMQQVWPKVIQQCPEARFYIAGRNAPESLRKYEQQRGVQVVGEVEDARAFILQHPLFVSPLWSGSGMRVKILEAMCMGRVVFTTSIGLEGIPAVSGRDIWVTDTAEAMADNIVLCLQNSNMLPLLQANSRAFIVDHFDKMHIGESLWQALQALLQPKSAEV